jgi:hypothetical protein
MNELTPAELVALRSFVDKGTAWHGPVKLTVGKLLDHITVLEARLKSGDGKKSKEDVPVTTEDAEWE